MSLTPAYLSRLIETYPDIADSVSAVNPKVLEIEYLKTRQKVLAEAQELADSASSTFTGQQGFPDNSVHITCLRDLSMLGASKKGKYKIFDGVSPLIADLCLSNDGILARKVAKWMKGMKYTTGNCFLMDMIACGRLDYDEAARIAKGPDATKFPGSTLSATPRAIEADRDKFASALERLKRLEVRRAKPEDRPKPKRLSITVVYAFARRVGWASFKHSVAAWEGQGRPVYIRDGIGFSNNDEELGAFEASWEAAVRKSFVTNLTSWRLRNSGAEAQTGEGLGASVPVTEEALGPLPSSSSKAIVRAPVRR